MSKEMSHELNDEVTDGIASKVLTTRRPAASADATHEAGQEEPALKSGVGKIELGVQPKHPPSRPLPLPVVPRAAPRVSAPVRKEAIPRSDTNSQMRFPETHKAQGYPLKDSKPRPSARPTIRPGVSPQVAGSMPIPKPPAVPVASGRGRVDAPSARPRVERKQEEEENTRVCPAAVIENLLSRGEASAEDNSQSAADELTKVGQVPIEELVLAERALAESNVGHEDVTRTYSFKQEQADPPSQVTSPGKRQQLSELQHEPLVIIQTDQPGRTPNKFAIALLVAVVCAAGAGWVYRGSVGRYAQSWHASFLRGISMVTGRNKPTQKAPAPRPAVIGLSISVTPPDALLVIDGLKVANPYVAQRHPDKLIHNLIVEAPGYVSLQRQVQFDRDLTVVLALAPIPQSTQADVVAEPPQPPIAAPTTPRARAHKAATKAATPTSAGVQTNCSPPYFIDASGIKSYKPECL